MRRPLVALGLTGALLAVAGPALAEWVVPSAATASATARTLGTVTTTVAGGVNQATISWTAETASGIVTGYRVERHTAAMGGTTVAVCPASLTSASLTCVDTGAPPGRSFWSTTAVYSAPGGATPTWTGPPSARVAGTVIALPVGGLGAPVLAAASDSGVSSSDRITNVRRPTFTGTATPLATVQLLIGGVVVGTGSAGPGGAYSIQLAADRPDGTYEVIARTTGTLGAVSAPTTFTVDGTAPAIVVTSAEFSGGSGNGVLRGTQGAAVGDLAASVSFQTNGQAPQVVAIPATSPWMVSFSLTNNRPYVAVVTRRDVAGNLTTVNFAFST